MNLAVIFAGGVGTRMRTNDRAFPVSSIHRWNSCSVRGRLDTIYGGA